MAFVHLVGCYHPITVIVLLRRGGLPFLEEGLKMIQAQPLTGIGTGNFKAFSGTLAGVAHNAYLEVAAELGVPGITFFAAVLVLTITTLARVQTVFRNCGATLIYHAAEGIQTGLVGACAIFFL